MGIDGLPHNPKHMNILAGITIFLIGLFCGYVNGIHRGRRIAEEKYFEDYEQGEDSEENWREKYDK